MRWSGIPRLFQVIAFTLLGVIGQGTHDAHDAMAAGQSAVVICGQDGATVVMLDRDGNPAKPSDGCRDCSGCLQQVAAVPRGHEPLHRRPVWSATLPVRTADAARSWRFDAAEARAPPLRDQALVS